jgi:hypothetical protein
MSEYNEELLGKIVALARGGVGGEKETAIKMVKALCVKHDLNFDEVMNASETVKEYWIDHKKREQDVLAQVICRYAHLNIDSGTQPSIGGERLYFKTTQEKYIETLNAWEVLQGLYTKEHKLLEKAFFRAFIQKHNLFYQATPEERRKLSMRLKKQRNKESDDDRRADEMGVAMSLYLTDADIMKRLTNKK